SLNNRFILMRRSIFLVLPVILFLTNCTQPAEENKNSTASPMREKLDNYTTVKLTADLGHLSDAEKQMIPKLIEAAKLMDELFWYEAYGDKNELLSSVSDEDTRQYLMINYGPWDRLDANKPFMEGIGEKPAGANFYPRD